MEHTLTQPLFPSSRKRKEVDRIRMHSLHTNQTTWTLDSDVGLSPWCESTCVCERSARRRVFTPSLNPQLPLHNQPQHWSPVPGNSIKEGLQRAPDLSKPSIVSRRLPHTAAGSICNTVRGVAHYCPSPVPLCLFCAADRRIQLPSRANKRECSYVKNRKRKKMRKRGFICRAA